MTPAQLHLCGKAHKEKQRDIGAYIYTLAALIRPMVWSEHPPEYEQVFRSAKKNEEMSDEQMYAVARALNQMFGGEEVD